MIFVFLMSFVLIVSALIALGSDQRYYVPAFTLIIICLIIMLICYATAVNMQNRPAKKLPGGAIIKLL